MVVMDIRGSHIPSEKGTLGERTFLVLTLDLFCWLV